MSQRTGSGRLGAKSSTSRSLGDRNPAGLENYCPYWVSKLFGFSASDGFALSADESVLWTNWLKLVNDEIGDAVIGKDQAYYLLSKMDVNLRKVLFTASEEGQVLNADEWRQAIRQLNVNPPLHPVLKEIENDLIFDEIGRGQNTFIDNVESKIHSIEKMPKLDRAAMLEDLSKRGLSSKLQKLVSANSREYQIAVTATQVRLPDGVVLEIEDKLKDGTLLVMIPEDRIIKTQDFMDPAIVDKYYQEKNLGAEGFWGNLLPDGHFVIFDQHHRVEAFAARNQNLVRIRITPFSDGNYYSSTHFSYLNFTGAWAQLDAATKSSMYQQAQVSPIKAIRDLYYKKTGFARVQ